MNTLRHALPTAALLSLLTGCSFFTRMYVPQASPQRTTSASTVTDKSPVRPAASAPAKLAVAPKAPDGMLDLRVVLGANASSDELPIFAPQGNELKAIAPSTTPQELAKTFHFKGADKVSGGISRSTLTLPGSGGGWVDCPIEFWFDHGQLKRIILSIPIKAAPGGYEDYAAHYADFRFNHVGSMDYATSTMKVSMLPATTPGVGFKVGFELKDAGVGGVAHAQSDRRGPLSAR